MGNKNQHYVSQTYLRGFGLPRDPGPPRAISLFAIGTQEVVHSAAIRKQCSRDYFYGRDNGPVEDLLQFFEGGYGAALASLQRGGLREDQLKALMEFLLLQLLRTPSQLQERL